MHGLVNNSFLQDRIKEIMLICFRAVEHKLERKSGYFDMLGFDFLIDDDMKVITAFLYDIHLHETEHVFAWELKSEFLRFYINLSCIFNVLDFRVRDFQMIQCSIF